MTRTALPDLALLTVTSSVVLTRPILTECRVRHCCCEIQSGAPRQLQGGLTEGACADLMQHTNRHPKHTSRRSLVLREVQGKGWFANGRSIRRRNNLAWLERSRRPQGRQASRRRRRSPRRHGCGGGRRGQLLHQHPLLRCVRVQRGQPRHAAAMPAATTMLLLLAQREARAAIGVAARHHPKLGRHLRQAACQGGGAGGEAKK